VLSEETQQGPFFLEELGRKKPAALYRYHQEWVEGLARAAEASKRDQPPDSPPGTEIQYDPAAQFPQGDTTNRSSNIDKVLTVFRGIATRDPVLTARYINPETYIEHNPHGGDGVDGLKAYVASFPSHNHHLLRVVRASQDGPYVFSQEEGLVLGGDIFFDIFRLANDLIVERCFQQKQLLPIGAGTPRPTAQLRPKFSVDTPKNKSIVQEYYKTIHISGDHSKPPHGFRGDHCIRNEPGVVDGVTLRGHLKSGQWWSLQNRPTERGLGLGCFTPLPPEEASLFLCANSVDRI
jgi:predicted SnoaL-like aldol condensation-catalyzing enzyme